MQARPVAELRNRRREMRHERDMLVRLLCFVRTRAGGTVGVADAQPTQRLRHALWTCAESGLSTRAADSAHGSVSDDSSDASDDAAAAGSGGFQDGDCDRMARVLGMLDDAKNITEVEAAVAVRLVAAEDALRAARGELAIARAGVLRQTAAALRPLLPNAFAARQHDRAVREAILHERRAAACCIGASLVGSACRPAADMVSVSASQMLVAAGRRDTATGDVPMCGQTHRSADARPYHRHHHRRHRRHHHHHHHPGDAAGIAHV